MRHILPLGAAIALASVAATQALADARTVRIEPRPYTSVIVTQENGVRVWRPMPPTELVIVNPGNKANVNIDIDARGRRSRTYNNFSYGH